MAIIFPPIAPGSPTDGSITYTDPATGVTYAWYGYWSAADPGTPGATGATGPGAGPTGASGATGASGVQGGTGPQGNPGSTGPISIVPGQPGPDGATGASGIPGFPGQRGATGPQGIAGTPGSIGLSGATGATGVGSPGSPGTPGGPGATGSPGNPGQFGPTGATGASGATGPRGLIGFQGPAGPPGASGATGPKGDPDGATGPQGATGNPGSPGPIGATGVDGSTGPKGDPGDPSGATGAVGSTGATGVVQASSPTFSIQFNQGNITLGGNSLLTYDGATLTAANPIFGDISGYASRLQTPRNINGVAFDGTSDITITSLTDGILTMGTSGTGLSGSATFNGNDATFIVDSNATDVSAPDTLVSRDSNSDFAAGTITADLAGNSASATRLETTRNINGIGFDGTQDITITALTDGTLTLETSGIGLSGDTTFNGNSTTFTVTSNATPLDNPDTIVSRNANGEFVASNIFSDLTGNAATATQFETARNINTVPFDGTQDITITAQTDGPLTLETSGNGLSGSAVFTGSTQTFTVDSNATDQATPDTIVYRNSSGGFFVDNMDTIGNVVIGGDLTVQGTEIILNTETIVVENKNIELGIVTAPGGPTDDTANGGGIELQADAVKSILWFKATNRWTSNVDFEAANFYGNLIGDVSGNISGDLAGNADTATQLQTPRNINTVAFDGTQDITITALTDGTLTMDTSGLGLAGSQTFNGNNATFTVSSNATRNADPNTIVFRDALNSFAGDLEGNSDSATQLETARDINNVPFDGTSDITITALTNGTLTMGTSGNGLSGSSTFNGANSTFTVTSNGTSSNSPSTLVFRDASRNFSANVITASLSGNATSASQLQTARDINGVAFNGTQDITITANTPGTLTMNTLGGGISGSATFNGSNSTFTVDLNSQTGSLADSVVLRDSTGSFAANVITANQFDGPSTRVSQPLSAGTDLVSSPAGNYDGSVARTFNVQSDTANTANRLVKRDGSGNFSAGTITATLSGTATNAQNVDVNQTNSNSVFQLLFVSQNATGFEKPLIDSDGGQLTYNPTSQILACQNFSGTLDGTSTRVENNLNAGFGLVGSAYNGSIARTWTVDSTDAATADKIVNRDSNGDFAANIITADLNGTATTATTANGLNTGNNYRVRSLGVGVNATGVAGEIVATNDITAFFSSDERLKENIKPIPNALEKLETLSGNTFDWKEGHEEAHSHAGADTGVIAQEVEALDLPGLVVDRDNGYKAVNYEKLVPLLIESIKELKAELDEVKGKI